MKIKVYNSEFKVSEVIKRPKPVLVLEAMNHPVVWDNLKRLKKRTKKKFLKDPARAIRKDYIYIYGIHCMSQNSVDVFSREFQKRIESLAFGVLT